MLFTLLGAIGLPSFEVHPSRKVSLLASAAIKGLHIGISTLHSDASHRVGTTFVEVARSIGRHGFGRNNYTEEVDFFRISLFFSCFQMPLAL